jgi:preprotein translocase subunit SecD
MIENLRARWAIILAIFAFAVIWTVPNFVNTENIWWPTKNRMVLGLDIQGGSHLVLRVDVDSAIKQDANRIAAQIPSELGEEKPPVALKAVNVTDPLLGVMRLELNQASDAQAVKSFLDRFYGETLRISEETASAITVEYSELYVRDFRSKLLDQAIATIRNRIDEFGVAEPSITAQGTDRILVQLPGIKDAATAKDLINRTARLDFMIVSREMSELDLQNAIAEIEQSQGVKLGELRYSAYVDKINEALRAANKIPPNTVVFFEKPEAAASMEVARVPYLLKQNEIVTGDRLTNAQVGMGEFNRPVVHFSFDAVGTRQFGELTRQHTREMMAIVLDKVVKSAPVINEPITGGRGQITLGGGRDAQQSLNEAKIIATALRAGALPATLEQLEERTVGPSLGADAIRKGQIATMLAGLAVFAFMFLYYRSFGLIANLALAFNLFLTIAILSALGATLTLPGVAGLALTLGISVDASVIIFERIKEEIAKGASMIAAIREGYDKAFSSIFDSNVTSIMVCIVLMYYGTGPVRGFAVTLMAGLVVTMFSSVFFTRSIFDLLVGRWKWNLSLQWAQAPKAQKG